MGLNFFKIIQKIESAFMFILLHGGLETIILFVFGEELYNKYNQIILGRFGIGHRPFAILGIEEVPSLAQETETTVNAV